MASRLDRIRDWSALAKKAEYDPKNLAKFCSVSLRQLERFAKETFGLTPQAWLKSLRLAEAQNLLRGGLSAKSTAFTLGYKQLSHFSREFKKHAGVPPTAFAAEEFFRTKLVLTIGPTPIVSSSDKSVAVR
jgi:AraC-like DNA-binding protein